MKVSELRIGNFVGIKNIRNFIADVPNNFEVTDIGDLVGLKDRGRQQWKIAELEPILLTEHWLLKFGFEYRNENTGIGSILDRKGQDYKSVSVGVLRDGEFKFLTTWHAPLKWVHQLQNLYFALTGAELLTSNATKQSTT